MAVMCPGVRDVGVLAWPGGGGVSVAILPGVEDMGVLTWPGGRGESVAMLFPGVREVSVPELCEP